MSPRSCVEPSPAAKVGAVSSIADNLENIRARVTAACAAAGRSATDVRLLAVSKTFGPEAIREAAAAGQRLFGENRVQEAAAKIPECPGRLEWHLVGHLQSNKAFVAANLFDWIHSVDSITCSTPRPPRGDGGAIAERVVARMSPASGNWPAARGGAGGAGTDSPPAECDCAWLHDHPPLTADPEKARPIDNPANCATNGRATRADLPGYPWA